MKHDEINDGERLVMSEKPREWIMSESILHFQNGVLAVGEMIRIVEKSALDEANAKISELEARLKHNHIIGKVYEVNAENMNRVIRELDETKSAYQALQSKLAEAELHIEALKGQLGYLPSQVSSADKYPQTIEKNLLAEGLMRKLEAAQARIAELESLNKWQDDKLKGMAVESYGDGFDKIKLNEKIQALESEIAELEAVVKTANDECQNTFEINWQQKKELKSKIQAIEVENNQLKRDYGTCDAERDTMKDKVQALESEIEQWKQRYQEGLLEKKKENRELGEQRDGLIGKVQALEAENERLSNIMKVEIEDAVKFISEENMKLKAQLINRDEVINKLNEQVSYFQWHDGIPNSFRASEWFIAETTYGDRVVLKALPEGYSYDFKTADETFIKKDKIKRWMQFPDSEYLPIAKLDNRDEVVKRLKDACVQIASGNIFSIMVSGVGTLTEPSRNKEVVLHEPIQIAKSALAECEVLEGKS